LKKIGLLVFVITLALSALGVGYSAWNSALNINGTVTPGTLSASIDVRAPGLVSSADYAEIVEGESTNSCLIVEITNAAAENIFTVNYIVVNTGTIPANVTFNPPVITASGPGASASDISINAPPDSELIEGGVSIVGSLTITVNESTPMTGDVSYSIELGIRASPP
jgi:hypothetical protein